MPDHLVSRSSLVAGHSEASPMKPPAPQTGPQGKQFLGEVVKVDAKAKQVVVRSKEGDKTFNTAKATLSGYQTIADMKPGDKVAILYDEKGGKLTAKLIANHAAMMKARLHRRNDLTHIQSTAMVDQAMKARLKEILFK